MLLFDRIRGGLVRYRLGAMVVVVGLILTTFGIHSAAAGGPTLTRIRIDLSGTADWQSVSFSDSVIGAHYVATQTAGSSVQRGYNTIVLHRGASTAAATAVDVLLEISDPDETSFAIKLAKSKTGEAHLKLTRTNTVSTQILSMNNYQSFGDCTVITHLSRAQYVAEGYTMPKVDSRRLVLAFYYPWFQEGSFDSGPWYDTPTTAYDTYAAAEIAKQADQAKAYGVDGFVISWDDIGNHTQRFDTMMAAARARSMYVTPCIELLKWETSTGSFDVSGIVSTMKLALERAADSAFLKVGTQPVLFVFGAYDLGPQVWQSVKAGLSAGGYNPFYVGEPTDPAYGFNGSYRYNPNGMSYSELLGKNAGSMRALRYSAQVNPTVKQRLWAATTSPGQNLSYYNPLFPKHEDRQSGQRYDVTWSAAVSTDPEWVLITSWNEWFEATHIVPSDRFGYTALQRTASWAGSFHNPAPPSAGEQSDGGLFGNLPAVPLKLRGV